MKKLFLIFLLMVSSPVVAQMEAGQKAPKIFFGLSFSPDYSDVITDKFYPPRSTMYDSIIAPIFGYTTGANMNYQFNNSFALDIGVHFSHRGYQSELIPFLNLGRIKAISNFTYIDVPVKVDYYVLNSNFSIYFTVGIISSFYVKDSYIEELHSYGGSIQTKDMFNPQTPDKINLMMLAGFGLDYHITERIFVRVEPIYRRSLSKIKDDASSDFYFWSLGSNVGVYFGF